MTEETKVLAPLWDCSVVLYRCGFAADGQIRREAREADPNADKETIEQMVAEYDYLTHALHNVSTTIREINKRFDASKGQYFIDGKDNFREKVATILPYKGNRDPNHKPKYYDEIKEYLHEKWDVQTINGMEADDALGIAQCEGDGKTVIVSIDKDMLQVPGYHFNWMHDELTFVEPDDGDMMFFYQLLTGDPTDNIQGIPKVGPKTARKILEQCYTVDQARNAVKQAYREKFGSEWESHYIENGMLLYIRRKDEEGCPLL